MEIINNDRGEVSADRLRRTSYIFLGVVLILSGALWLCYNYGLLLTRFFDILFSWQSLVTIIGIWLLVTKKWIAGGITTAVGLLFLTAEVFCFYISFTKVVMPVLLIVFGILLLAIKEFRK